MSATGPAVRVACSTVPGQVEDWSLVLQSAGIGYELASGPLGLELWVDTSELAAAQQALEAFDRETRSASAPRPTPIAYGPTRAGGWIALGLLALFAITGGLPPELRDQGAADARAILRGEVWRAITALTLHADLGHVLGNAASCLVFGTLLLRALGPGLGGLLALATGAAVNLVNSWIQGPGHVSVGASSALFGAIGILCGLQTAERWRWIPRRTQSWLPLAAGLGLLAMLGVGGARTDVLAHALGLLLGAPVGVAIGLALERPFGAAVQVWLVAASLLSLAGAWGLAIR